MRPVQPLYQIEKLAQTLNEFLNIKAMRSIEHNKQSKFSVNLQTLESSLSLKLPDFVTNKSNILNQFINYSENNDLHHSSYDTNIFWHNIPARNFAIQQQILEEINKIETLAKNDRRKITAAENSLLIKLHEINSFLHKINGAIFAKYDKNNIFQMEELTTYELLQQRHEAQEQINNLEGVSILQINKNQIFNKNELNQLFRQDSTKGHAVYVYDQNLGKLHSVTNIKSWPIIWKEVNIPKNQKGMVPNFNMLFQNTSTIRLLRPGELISLQSVYQHNAPKVLFSKSLGKLKNILKDLDENISNIFNKAKHSTFHQADNMPFRASESRSSFTSDDTTLELSNTQETMDLSSSENSQTTDFTNPEELPVETLESQIIDFIAANSRTENSEEPEEQLEQKLQQIYEFRKQINQVISENQLDIHERIAQTNPKRLHTDFTQFLKLTTNLNKLEDKLNTIENNIVEHLEQLEQQHANRELITSFKSQSREIREDEQSENVNQVTLNK